MNCFDVSFREPWLAEQRIAQPILKRFADSAFDHKMVTPPSMRQVIALNERLMDEVIGASHVGMIEIEDWPLYQKSEMELLLCIRNAFGEKRALREAPCHSFTAQDSYLALAMFALTIALKWKSTIYFAPSDLIIHNWEGDFLEFYCSGNEQLKMVVAVTAEFEG